MKMTEYNPPANAQAAAAAQTMASQQKQAQLFKGGASVQSPNMGGDQGTQTLADNLTQLQTKQYSQAINDQRYAGGRRKRVTRRRRRKNTKKRRGMKSRKNMYRKK